MGSRRCASEFVKFLGTYIPYKMMQITSQVSEEEYIELVKGKTGRIVDRVKLFKSYCRKENIVSLAVKEADSESLELPYGEMRGGPKHIPEEVQISHSLSLEQ